MSYETTSRIYKHLAYKLVLLCSWASFRWYQKGVHGDLVDFVALQHLIVQTAHDSARGLEALKGFSKPCHFTAKDDSHVVEQGETQ